MQLIIHDEGDTSVLLERCEKTSNRYIEAEEFLMELAAMNPIERLMSQKKIVDFLKSRLDKYDF